MSLINDIITLMGNDMNFTIWVTVLAVLLLCSRPAPISLGLPVTLVATHVYYLFHGNSAYEVVVGLYQNLSAGSEFWSVLNSPESTQLLSVAGVAFLGYLAWCLGNFIGGKVTSRLFGRKES